MAPTERISMPSSTVEASPRWPRCRAVGCTAASTRGLLRRWALVAFLVTVAVMACSKGPPADQPQFVYEKAGITEVRLLATASVEITAEPESPTAPISSIQVSPSPIVVDPGKTVQLSARAYGPDGHPLSDIEFVWTGIDTRAGAIAKDGRFQAGTRPGVFENSISVTGIQNTPEGTKYASATASVTVVGEVRVPVLSSVVIMQENPTVLKQQILRMHAVGFDEDGRVIPGVSLVWELNDARLGRVNELGLLTVEGEVGTYPDAVVVTATWQGVALSAVTDVQVVSTPEADDFLDVHALPQRFFLEPGDRYQLRAVALNGLGEVVAGTQPRWSMADERAGSIDGYGNFVAGGVPGVYTQAVKVEVVIPGEVGFVRAVDFASVVIRHKEASRRLRAVSVVPETVVLPPGARATLAVKAVDESGEPVQNVAVSWEESEEEAGEVSALGSFKAGNTPGAYPAALVVTVEQQLDDETVTVTKTANVVITGRLSGAELQPQKAVVAAGKTVHFSLRSWDENEVDLSRVVVLWSLSDERIGSIDAFGNFIAGHVAGVYEGAIRAEVIQTLPDPR